MMQLLQELRLKYEEGYRQWMSQQGPILQNIKLCATIYSQERHTTKETSVSTLPSKHFFCIQFMPGIPQSWHVP